MLGLGGVQKGAGSRNNWRSWAGVAVALALLVGFCLWVYISIRSEPVPIPSDAAPPCKNTADIADSSKSKFAELADKNTKSTDDGRVCLIRPTTNN